MSAFVLLHAYSTICYAAIQMIIFRYIILHRVGDSLWQKIMCCQIADKICKSLIIIASWLSGSQFCFYSLETSDLGWCLVETFLYDSSWYSNSNVEIPSSLPLHRALYSSASTQSPIRLCLSTKCAECQKSQRSAFLANQFFLQHE